MTLGPDVGVPAASNPVGDGLRLSCPVLCVLKHLPAPTISSPPVCVVLPRPIPPFCPNPAACRALSSATEGHVTIVASLYAHGVLYVHDATGEEVLAYDTGHGQSACALRDGSAECPSSPSAPSDPGEAVVSGLSVDTSETDPVLLTTGTDGTLRVHALTVYLNGRKIIGRSSGGGDSSGRKQRPVGTGGGSSGRSGLEASREEGYREGESDGGDGGVHSEVRRTPSGQALHGLEIVARPRLCLGLSCPSDSGDEAGEMSSGAQGVLTDDGGRRTNWFRADGATVTSTAIFHHRGWVVPLVRPLDCSPRLFGRWACLHHSCRTWMTTIHSPAVSPSLSALFQIICA